MQVLTYIYLSIAVFILAFFSSSFTGRKEVRTGISCDTKISDTERRIPWLNITMIGLILGLYSKFLGVSGGLVDRITYIYNFHYRYPAYYSSFEALLKAKTEPGIVVVSMLIAKFTDNALWLFFIITFITTMINLYVISRLSKDYAVVVLLMFFSLFFFDGIYLIKQVTAVAFANLAFYSLVRERKGRYFIYSLIACLFHSTAVIMLPMYLIFRKSGSKKAYVTAFAVFVALFVYLGPLIKVLFPNIPFVSQYLTMESYGYTLGGGSTASFIKGIPFYIITILSIVNREALKKELKHADLYIMSSAFYSMFWMLTFNMYWFYRVGWYLMFPVLIMIPALFRCIKENKAYLFLAGTGILFLLAFTIRQIFITF